MRRLVVASIVALASVLSPPVSAETLKVVMHSDVKALDPIWSGAYITRNHGYMVWDTLFALDGNLKVKPQMVDSWTTSPDGLTWTFRLRDGLEWHDGTPVTAEDCVASLKRWSARDSMGQKLAQALQEYKIVDPATFQIVLKQKFGPLLEAIGKPSVVVPFMMPKRLAEVDAFKAIDDPVGSGPFIFKKDEWKPGEKVVYVKNPKYKPRPEPASGLAGGKVVKLDRVEWVWIPDAETQLNALLNGEIDMLEAVSYDHLPVLEKSKDVRVIANKTRQPVRLPHELADAAVQQREGPPGRRLCAEPGGVPAGQYRRQALLPGMQGDVHLRHAAGHDRRHGRPDRGQRREGAANSSRRPATTARRSSFRSLPISGSSSSSRRSPRRSSRRRASRSKSSPWTGRAWWPVSTTKKGPPSEGGWNAFGTSWVQLDILDPLMTPNLATTCEKARAGWPCDEGMEKLRDKFVAATTEAEKKAVAEEVQRYAMEIVTHVPLGEWFGVGVVRANIQTPAVPPPITIFWGVSKK